MTINKEEECLDCKSGCANKIVDCQLSIERMNFEIIFVLLALVGMIAALIWDGLRPGMVLLTVVVLFLCAGILTPKELLEGFSNKGMITVGMLFLVSEGIRQSGALGQLIKKLLPEGKTTVCFRLLLLSPLFSTTRLLSLFSPLSSSVGRSRSSCRRRNSGFLFRM